MNASRFRADTLVIGILDVLSGTMQRAVLGDKISTAALLSTLSPAIGCCRQASAIMTPAFMTNLRGMDVGQLIAKMPYC